MESVLNVVDYVVLVAMLVVFLVVGYLFRTRESSTVDDYLISNRSMSPWPVGFSIAVTVYSGVALTVVVGELYAYGSPAWLSLPAGIAAHLLVNHTVVPFFYRSKYLSVYQFIEERFNKPLRNLSLLIFFVGGMMFVAVGTYVACMSVNEISGIPIWISAILVGIVCSIYSAVGGIKAVVWTDVIQTVTMFLFLFLIIGKVVVEVGSLTEIWERAIEGGRIHFSFRDGPKVRYNVPNFFCSYTLTFLFFMGANQACVQRWQCTANLRDAQKSVVIASWLFGAFGICVSIAGAGLYAYFKGCDVVRAGVVQSEERIPLYFMVNHFGHLPGLVGLALSGVLNGSFSTFSSVVNSFAAVTLEDFVKPCLRRTLSNKEQILLCKAFTLVYGAVCTGLVFVVSASGSAIMVQGTSQAATAGPMIAILIFGLFFKCASSKGVALGAIISMAFVSWMSIGSYLSSVKHQKLPMNMSACSSGNDTHFISEESEGLNENDDVFPLYNVSFYWFSVIGLLVALVTGACLSLICPDKEKQSLPGQQFQYPVLKTLPVIERNDNALQMEDINERKIWS